MRTERRESEPYRVFEFKVNNSKFIPNHKIMSSTTSKKSNSKNQR